MYSRAILAAMEAGNDAMAMFLVSAGISPGVDAMTLAIQQKNLALVSLFAHIIDFTEEKIRNDPHTCILCEAVKWGDTSVFNTLVRAGVSLDCNIVLAQEDGEDLGIGAIFDEFGRCFDWIVDPLSLAILKGNSAIVESILASGAVPNATWAPWPGRSIDSGRPTGKITALAACLIRKNRNLAQQLLDSGTDPLDNAAIYMAVVLEEEGMIRFLISAFISRYPSGEKSFGVMALISAIRADQQHVVDSLSQVVCVSSTPENYSQEWQEWYKIESQYISPVSEVVSLACSCDHLPDHLVTLLRLQRDPDSIVFTQGSTKRTCLLHAIHLRSLPTVRLLIEEFGADASQQALFGLRRTPLQAAVEIGDLAMVQYLIEQGATAKDQPAHKNGATALQLAAIQDLAAIAVILLENGADVNADPALMNGRTAFEGATEHGHIDMMRFLVQNGADLVANDDQQQHRRAVNYAEKSGQYAAIEFANSLLQECLRGEHGIPASFGVGSTTLFGFEGSSIRGSSQAAFDF